VKSEARTQILKQASLPLFSYTHTTMVAHCNGEPWMYNSAITFHDG